MAYDEYLEERVANMLNDKRASYTRKRMMGGLTFMVDEKMCVGIIRDSLMARISPEIYDDCLKIEGCKPMDFTGRPMRGFVYVEPEAIDLDEDLENWVQLCLDYNPEAKSSKKN